MGIKEKKGSYCPECKTTYLETRETCYHCNKPTENILYYTRVRVERFAFCFSLGVLAGLLTVIITKDLDALLPVSFITLLFLLSAYHTANFLLQIGGGFAEKYEKDSIPEDAKLSFSWPKYFQEIKGLGGVLLACFLLGGAYALFKEILR